MRRLIDSFLAGLGAAIDMLVAALAQLRGNVYLTRGEVDVAHTFARAHGWSEGWQDRTRYAIVELEDAEDRGWVEGFDMAIAYARLQAADVLAQVESDAFLDGYLTAENDRVLTEVMHLGAFGGIR